MATVKERGQRNTTLQGSLPPTLIKDGAFRHVSVHLYAQIVAPGFRRVHTMELVSASLDYLAPMTPVEPSGVEYQFRRLADEWRAATAAWSSAVKRYMHPSYQRIIGLGAPVVPLLIKDLPHDWFYALSVITRENPVPAEDRGNIQAMTKAWREWSSSRPYRD